MPKEKHIKEKEELINYLKENDYQLYSKDGRYYFIHKDFNNSNYKKEYGNTQFSLEYSTLNIVGEGKYNNINIKKQCAMDKFKPELTKDKDYFKLIEYLIKRFEQDDIINFVEKLPALPQDKVKLLENLPVSILESYNTNFEKVRTLLNKAEYSQNDQEKFFLKFFKARKNQLKGKIGESAEKFILSLYGNNEEKLSPYFDFFPNIKNRFQSIELDIEEPGYIVFSQRFNIRKAAKILRGKPESKIQNWIQVFSANMAKKYQVWSSLEVIDRSNAIIEIRFYKTDLDMVVDKKLNLDNYSKKLKKFLVYMLSLTEEPNINFNYINKWLDHTDLTEVLDRKNTKTETEAKTKVNKI